MPPKSPSLYDLKKTTIAFAIAGVLLSISLFWMVFQDSSREWKGWQKKFMDYTRQQAQTQLEETRKKIDQNKLKEIQDALQKAKADQAAHRKEIKKLKKESAHTDVEWTKAKAVFQGLKQQQESDRYFFEEARAQGRKREEEKYQKRMAGREPVFQKARLAMEAGEVKNQELENQLKKFEEAQLQASREMTQLFQDQTLLEKKIKKLRPDLVKAILNAPMLDFIRPTWQIQQIVVENLYDDFYFSKAQKVDRCITCHLGIDQKGFSAEGGENVPQPFKSHPRLDLFLSSNSPHPMEKFGCTVCHSGSGHSATFTTAAHTPRNEEQAKEWKKKYHWHEMQHWAEKMLPVNHTEASCAKCHSGVSEVPQAPHLNEGRHLAETFGCYGCHKVEGAKTWLAGGESASGGKVGPSLMHVQSKLEQDWIIRWLQNPKEFRPSTQMPRIFHLSNTSDPASIEKSNAVIAGIASYLIKNSDPITLTAPPVEGKAEKGEQLVKELGCTGCHTVAGASANDHGPELTGLGSKVKAEWLYTWIKNPKIYHEQTRMPQLRLSDEEAAHITAYLLSLRNEKFESIQPPLIKPETVDRLTVSYLTGSIRQQEAKEKAAAMKPEEKLEFIGQKAIAHQGCFGCHDIKGFSAKGVSQRTDPSFGGENEPKPIGTELTQEATKDIHEFYFGFVDIPETKQSWFAQKLREPRIFDKGKEGTYLEKLRMPQFDFTDGQIESLVTFLLSTQKTDIPAGMTKNLTSEEKNIEAGRPLVNKFNCNGCHTLDGKEGKIQSLYQDEGQAPPIILGEGKKVQANWLYHFLENPTTIRPWLKIRMPTFGFSKNDLTTMVQYFHDLDQAPPAFGETEKPATTPEELETGKLVFQKLQCIKCHKSNSEPGLSASFLAPDLVMSKHRLRQDWVIDWMKDPQKLLPGTMMPMFFMEGQPSPIQDIYDGDAAKQIKAMRDYIWEFTPEEAAAVQTGNK